MARVRPYAIGQHANLRQVVDGVVSTNHNIRQYVGDVDHGEGVHESIGKWVVDDRHPFAVAKVEQLGLDVPRVERADGQQLI